MKTELKNGIADDGFPTGEAIVLQIRLLTEMHRNLELLEEHRGAQPETRMIRLGLEAADQALVSGEFEAISLATDGLRKNLPPVGRVAREMPAASYCDEFDSWW